MGIIHMPGFCGFGRCCAGRASIDHMGKMFRYPDYPVDT